MAIAEEMLTENLVLFYKNLEDYNFNLQVCVCLCVCGKQ